MRQGQNLRLYRSLAALSPVNPFLFLPCFRPFPTFSFLFLAIFDRKLREKREKWNIIPNSLGPKRENGSGPKFSSLKIPLVPRSSRSASRYFRFISGWHLGYVPVFLCCYSFGAKMGVLTSRPVALLSRERAPELASYFVERDLFPGDLRRETILARGISILPRESENGCTDTFPISQP